MMEKILRIEGLDAKLHIEDYKEGDYNRLPVREVRASIDDDSIEGIIDLNEAFLVMFSEGHLTIEYDNDNYKKVKEALDTLDVKFYSSLENFREKFI